MVRGVWRERQGPAMEGLVGYTEKLTSYCDNKREPQEHGSARFTFYQAPLYCFWAEGEFECDKTVDKGW